MDRNFPDWLLQELRWAVKQSADQEGMVNVPFLAADIKTRFGSEPICLEEVEAKVMSVALALKTVIYFQRPDAMPANREDERC